MQLIEPSYEILSFPENILENIEKAARTCYKSEDKITPDSAKSLVIHLIEHGHHAMLEFGGVITVKFFENRGFTHELVRHRVASFAQESTRYCNYSAGKFNSQITCIDPTQMIELKAKDPDSREKIYDEMIKSWNQCEENYLKLIDLGAPAEVAREVLPIGLKAEIVIMANVREWRHILLLRASPKAHPRMREVMDPLLEEFRSKCPVIFDDL